MVNKMNDKYYRCKKCGLYYLKKNWADKCWMWCSKHRSCNINIIKHSIMIK